VLRTSKGAQVPVYTDYKNGRTRSLTIIRKITGDTAALAREVVRVTGGAAVAVHPGRVEVEGDRSKQLKMWLMGLGF
jgi:large subunit ribosomal protein L49